MSDQFSRVTRAAVRGSTTGRPLMAALDLLGRRWALRILWELRGGPIGARALRDRCDGMSSSVLYDRLRELSDAALITQTDGDAYSLTETGSALGRALKPLDDWAESWMGPHPRRPEPRTSRATPPRSDLRGRAKVGPW